MTFETFETFEEYSMNVWVNIYNGRKTFSIGNSVFWDKVVLTRPQIDELIQEYGPDYFEVMSLILYNSLNKPYIRIGRNSSFVIKTSPKNIIKI